MSTSDKNGANDGKADQLPGDLVDNARGPIQQFFWGLQSFIRGTKWLASHPVWGALLLVPFLAGGAAFAGGVWLFFEYSPGIYERILFTRPESYMWLALWYVLKGAVGVAMFLAVLGASIVVAAIISSPVLEKVSLAVERDCFGGVPAGADASFFSLRIMVEELKKAVISILIPLLVLITPGINILTPLVTAFILGWNMYDYPFARRGIPLGQRFKLALKDAPALTGLGFWLILPFAQIFLMPFAVVGATMVACDRIKRM